MNDNDECCYIDQFNEDEQEEDIINDKYKSELPGLLMLDRTYGKKGKRYLYKVVPSNKDLPSLLIPYDKKIEFSKELINKYILFKYENFDVTPIQGILIRTIGDVTDLNAYFEYMIYSKELQINNTLFKKTIKQINIKDVNVIELFNKYYNNNIVENAFTIDCKDTEHFDDAISIIENEKIEVNVYITDLCVWFQEYNLWDLLQNEMKTIYLPNKKINMLPNDLIDVANLKSDTTRITLNMRVIIENNKPIDISFSNKLVYIENNFVYNSNELLNNEQYKKLFEITNSLDNNVENSSDVISFWMIFMNNKVGELFANKNIGIFKINYLLNNKNFLQELVEKKGINYYETDSSSKYVQITSPLRRRVDIYNQSCLLKYILQYNYNSTIYDINNCNETMKKIRKLENHCDLIYRLTNENDEEKIYTVETYGNIKVIKELNKIIYDDRDLKHIKIKIKVKREKKSVLLEEIKYRQEKNRDEKKN